MPGPIVNIPLPSPAAGTLAVMALPQDPASLNAVAAWQPDLIVTLMTVDEIAAKGVTNAVTDVAKLVTDWRHVPIIDYGVPGPAFEAAWPALSTDLHQLIDDGKRVLIHCHGGIGRSGLISARLLVDRGLSPAAAVAAVRSVRPGAIETAEQEHSLTAYAAQK